MKPSTDWTVKSRIWQRVARWAGGHSKSEETTGLLCVVGLMDPLARPVLNTKIILNKSGTVGACLVLRQRVCVRQHHYSRRCLIALVLRWTEKLAQMKTKEGAGCCLTGHVFSLLPCNWVIYGHIWQITLRCSYAPQILLRRDVYLSTLCLGKD